MKRATMKWLTVLLLVGAALTVNARDPESPAARADQAQWEQLPSTVRSSHEAALLSSASPSSPMISSERFSIAESQCSANAVALLNINDLLKSAANEVQLGWKEAWSGKTAVFLRRTYADHRDFFFVCLIDRDGRLQRTRLVRPVQQSKSFAVEIDASRYVYGTE